MPVPFRRAALAQGPELVEGQFRLTAPIFRYPHIETHNVCGGRQLAQLGLQILAGSGQPFRRASLAQSPEPAGALSAAEWVEGRRPEDHFQMEAVM